MVIFEAIKIYPCYYEIQMWVKSKHSMEELLRVGWPQAVKQVGNSILIPDPYLRPPPKPPQPKYKIQITAAD